MEKVLEFIKKHWFIIGLFIFSFIIRLVVIITIDTPIISDFNDMYQASLELLNHTENYKDTTYFLIWGYQMGHVLYQFFLLKICNSVFFLKLVNCIVTSFAVVFVYLISKKLVSENFARITSLIYSIFLFPLLLNTVLTNQHLPLLLILIAVYILINMEYISYKKKSIIIGILLALSNILRSEVIVIIVAIFLYYIVLAFKKESIKKLICSFLLILISYMAIFQGTSILLTKLDISRNGLKNMNPAWKFVLGFNYGSNGMWNADDASNFADYETCKEITKQRIMQYDRIPSLFYKKAKIMWLDSDLSWSIGHFDNMKLFNLLDITNKLFVIFFDITTLISIVVLIKNKFPKEQTILISILLVYFGVYLLIEVQSRYAYSFQVFQAILSGVSLEYIFKLIIKLKGVLQK